MARPSSIPSFATWKSQRLVTRPRESPAAVRCGTRALRGGLKACAAQDTDVRGEGMMAVAAQRPIVEAASRQGGVGGTRAPAVAPAPGQKNMQRGRALWQSHFSQQLINRSQSRLRRPRSAMWAGGCWHQASKAQAQRATEGVMACLAARPSKQRRQAGAARRGPPTRERLPGDSTCPGDSPAPQAPARGKGPVGQSGAVARRRTSTERGAGPRCNKATARCRVRAVECSKLRAVECGKLRAVECSKLCRVGVRAEVQGTTQGADALPSGGWRVGVR